MGRVTARRRVVRVEDGAHVERMDTLVGEEPLEIRAGGRALAVTMRTPGDDFDLVAGFLWTEGLLHTPDDLESLRYCAGVDDTGQNTYNVIDVVLRSGAVPIPSDAARAFYTSSSCGLCGKASVDAVRVRASYDVHSDQTGVDPTVLASLPDKLRAAQAVFEQTGGLHAAGLFTAEGELVTLREDVGRHNAVDKVIGAAVRDGRLPLAGHILLVSGRASFELVQKALLAGIPALAAVSAPSTLAADLAEEAGMTLVGFLRGTTMNVYAGAFRLSAPVLR
jgi:FdhD protein